MESNDLKSQILSNLWGEDGLQSYGAPAQSQIITYNVKDKVTQMHLNKVALVTYASSRMEGKFHFEDSEDEVPDILGEPTQVYTYGLLLNI